MKYQVLQDPAVDLTLFPTLYRALDPAWDLGRSQAAGRGPARGLSSPFVWHPWQVLQFPVHMWINSQRYGIKCIAWPWAGKLCKQALVDVHDPEAFTFGVNHMCFKALVFMTSLSIWFGMRGGWEGHDIFSTAVWAGVLTLRLLHMAGGSHDTIFYMQQPHGMSSPRERPR